MLCRCRRKKSGNSAAPGASCGLPVKCMLLLTAICLFKPGNSQTDTGKRIPLVQLASVEAKLDAMAHSHLDSLYPAAVFAALYRNVLHVQLQWLQAGELKDSVKTARMVLGFYAYFNNAVRQYLSTDSAADAWMLAFRADSARSFLHHVLLGINAHVYNDLSLALMSSLGPDGMKGYRREFRRLNKAFRTVNRRLEAKMTARLQMKGWQRLQMSAGSRLMMRMFRRQRRRAFSLAKRCGGNGGFCHCAGHFRQARRVSRNAIKLERVFSRNWAVLTTLRRLDGLSGTEKLDLLRLFP